MNLLKPRVLAINGVTIDERVGTTKHIAIIPIDGGQVCGLTRKVTHLIHDIDDGAVRS
jgi:hypothetical protein